MTRIRSTDKSHIDDRRGQSSGGSGFPGGFPIPGGLKAGGGLLGVVVLLASLLLPKLLGAGATSSLSSDTGEPGASTCATELEQIVCGVTNDVQAYWAQAYAQKVLAPRQSDVTTSMTSNDGGVTTPAVTWTVAP